MREQTTVATKFSPGNNSHLRVIKRAQRPPSQNINPQNGNMHKWPVETMDYTTAPVTTDALNPQVVKQQKIICDGEIIAHKQTRKIPTIWEKQRLLIIIRIVKSLPFTFTTKGHYSTFRNDALESLPPDKLYLRYNCWEAIQDWTTEQAPNGEQIGVD